MAKVKLKNSGEVIKVKNYGEIHDGNLTFELYTWLTTQNPNLKVHFVEESEEAKPAKSSKQKD